MRISRDRDGALELRGRSWQEDGSLSARCCVHDRHLPQDAAEARANYREVMARLGALGFDTAFGSGPRGL
jgi:hypothetical protein